MTNPLKWLALVALDRPELPEVIELVDRFAKQFPDAPKLDATASTDALITMTLGDYTAAATLVPRPIPWSQLEGPCATAWYWPDAADALRDHESHLMVTLIDEAGSPLVKAMHLTQVVAAVSEETPSRAVFWGPSRMVHPAAAFIEQATQMKEDDWPLFVWVDFRIEQLDGGGARLFTTGLEALGRSEIEVERFDDSPQELLEHAYNFAHYLLSQPKEINDGDTVGLTDELQATVYLRPSMFDANLEVIQLQFTPSSE